MNCSTCDRASRRHARLWTQGSQILSSMRGAPSHNQNRRLNELHRRDEQAALVYQSHPHTN